MTKSVEVQEQISDIQQFIAETRSRFEGGGVVGLVWGLLTAGAVLIVVMARPAADGQTLTWAAHNALGWAFTWYWFVRASEKEGRATLRSKLTLRLWALVTVAVWCCVLILGRFALSPSAELFLLLDVILGLGIFATGLLSESGVSQGCGAALTVIPVVLAATAPPSMLALLGLAAIPVVALAWGVSSWLVRRPD